MFNKNCGPGDPDPVLTAFAVPLTRPTYLAYALVSVSHHWNNFLWPLIITNSVEIRPLTVGLGITFLSLAFVNMMVYSLLAGQMNRFFKNKKSMRMFKISGGRCMICAGLYAAAAKHR